MTEHAVRYGLADPAALEGLGGLEQLRRVIDGRLPQIAIGGLLGFDVVEADEGRVVVAGSPDERHLNYIGTVHAGYAATLLDTAMACSVITTLKPDEGFTTMEFKLSLLKPVTAGMGEVRATGTLLQRGRRAAFAEGRLEDAAGRLLAHATTTCIVLAKG